MKFEPLVKNISFLRVVGEVHFFKSWVIQNDRTDLTGIILVRFVKMRQIETGVNWLAAGGQTGSNGVKIGSYRDRKKLKKGKNGIVVPDDTHRHLVYSALISSVITVKSQVSLNILGTGSRQNIFRILTIFDIFSSFWPSFFHFCRFLLRNHFLFLLIFGQEN